MKFDNIIANPPYAKIGGDITKKVIEQNPDSNYAMLGTRSMFKPFYADTLACRFVQIGRYELGTNNKLDWGVEQAILLATNGWTEVIDNRKKVGENKVGIDQQSPCFRGFSIGRTSHLVGVNEPYVYRTGTLAPRRSTHLVGGAMDRHTANPTDTKPTDVKLRNGYIYVSFETFEEACERAIDIISWTNPTDSHYRCVRWGFVCGLVPHYKERKL